MNRRQFLKQFGLLSAGLAAGVPSSLQALAPKSRTVTVLYTNDTHSRIDPFPKNAGDLAGLGGYARRAALIQQIRAEQPHVLLLDAGDIFQGTPYFNFYNGKLELELMSKMGYDASAVGNHEFDNGVKGFCEVASAAEFPFLCANYHFGDSPMGDFCQNYLIKEFDGVKIGIFGLGIAFEGLILDDLHQGITYRDAVILARAMVRSLKTYEQCDYVICLSHLGYRYRGDRVSDYAVAQQVEGIDLIIGGHTHTFLDQPETVAGPQGSNTLVTQVGWGGVILGRIDLNFSESGAVTNQQAAALPITHTLDNA